MDKKSCENCGHFLQYYAFLGGIHFRPVCYGKCLLKRVHKGYVEIKESACEQWCSNQEMLEKQNHIIEARLHGVAEQLNEVLMILSAKEK